jgi:hypothetical protein
MNTKAVWLVVEVAEPAVVTTTYLTQEDLKESGVGPLGHRRKLLDAIALLRGDAATKAPPPEAPSAMLLALPALNTKVCPRCAETVKSAA